MKVNFLCYNVLEIFFRKETKMKFFFGEFFKNDFAGVFLANVGAKDRKKEAFKRT